MGNDGELIGSSNMNDAINMSRDEVLGFLRQISGEDPSDDKGNVFLEQLIMDGSSVGDVADLSLGTKNGQGPKEALFSFLKSMTHVSLSNYIAERGLAGGDDGVLECSYEEKLSRIAKALLSPANANIVIHVSSNKLAGEIAAAALKEMNAQIAESGMLWYLYSLSIEELDLGTRSSNVLRRAKVETVADLCALGRDRVAEMRGSGAKTIGEIEEALRGLSQLLVDDFSKRQNPIGEYVRHGGSSMGGMGGQEGLRSPEEGLDLPQELFSVEFDAGELSRRARNALRFAKAESLGEVLELGEEGLLSLRNAGRATVAEIVKSADKQMEDYLIGHPWILVRTVGEEPGRRAAEGEEAEDADRLRDGYEDEIRLAVRDLVTSLSESMVISPTVFLRALLGGASIDVDEVRDVLAAHATHSLLVENPWGLTIGELKLAFSEELGELSDELVTRGVEQAAERGLIQEKEGLLFAVELSLRSAINHSLKSERERAIVQGRIAGKTYGQIGEGLSIGKEKAEQIFLKAIGKVSFVGSRAYQYYLLLRDYELTERHCCDGLSATLEEWNVASSLFDCADDDAGGYRYPATELLHSKRLPQRVKLQLEGAIYHGYIKVKGEYVKASRKDLALYVLKINGSERSITDAEFIEKYYEFLAQLGLDADGELALSERYTATMRQNKFVISGNGKRMRYYDYRERDIPRLLRGLKLKKYCDKEVSTKVFLQNEPELLSDYDIVDPYELHSLLRKYYEGCGEQLDLPFRPCRRMPMLIVGKTASREKQVKALARKLAPVSAEELARAYEREYGVDPRTFIASYLIYVKECVSDGCVRSDRVSKKKARASRKADHAKQEAHAGRKAGPVKKATRANGEADYAKFDFIERYRLREALTDDCYSLDQIERIYFGLFPDASKEKVNSCAIEDLGFKMRSGIAVREER